MNRRDVLRSIFTAAALAYCPRVLCAPVVGACAPVVREDFIKALERLGPAQRGQLLKGDWSMRGPNNYSYIEIAGHVEEWRR